jgi:hypothetical protein
VLLAPHPSVVPPWPADCGCQPAPTRCLLLQPHLAAGAWRLELEYYAAAARSRGQSQVAHVQVFSWIGGGGMRCSDRRRHDCARVGRGRRRRPEGRR